MDTWARMMAEDLWNWQRIPEERYKFKIGDLVTYTFPNNESITGKIISIDRSTTFVPYVVSFGKNPTKIGFYFWIINRKVNYSMPFIDSIKDSYDGEWCAVLREDELSLVERVEDDMVTINDIKKASMKLKDMIDEFKKNYEGNSNGFRFKEGDLVVVTHRLGDVAGYVVSCHVAGGNEGEDKIYTVFLPNDFRGEDVFDLPTSDYSKFIILHHKYGTFIYAQEDELRKMCK